MSCPICFNKPMNCDCSEEARQLYYLRQEMGEQEDNHMSATPEAVKQVVEAIAKLEKPYDKQAERKELFKQVALAVISNNYHHSDWLLGADWINPVVENILIAADEFSKKDSHE